MKTDLFQSCGHCWVFQICWHIECSTFTASCFRIWKSSTGIPSPPVALFIVMLPKAHLTSLSRMSGSRWVITPWWLSGSWRSFLYSYYLYSCHLFLISYASVRSIPFLSFIEPIAGCYGPCRSVVERSYPMSDVRGGGQEELPHVWGGGSGRECQTATAQERRRGATPRPRSGMAAGRNNPTPKQWWLCRHRRAKRSYSTFKVRMGGGEEISLVQGKEQ